MKRTLEVVFIVALLLSSPAHQMSLSDVIAAPQSHKLDTIKPVTNDWPQKEDNWCGAAVLQAYIDYAWRFHHNDPGYYYTQDSLWDFMRDHTTSHLFPDGFRGIGSALPGTVGDGYDDVRRMNMAYDFGVDPSALTWMMQLDGHDYYHYAIYRDGLYHATRWLLWTVEYYQEPIAAAMLHGSHYVLVIGYEAERSATHPDGPGNISKVRVADPLYGPGETAYKWRPWDSIWPWVDTWPEIFTEYTASGDPDPSTGWYVPPPNLWQGGRVTIERDQQNLDYSPDWAVDGDTWQIMDHHAATFLPDVRANSAGWDSTIIIRNNGSSSASASAISYNSGGYGSGTSARTAHDNSLIPPRGTWELDASAVVNNFTGSAIAYASQDVSVMVRTLSSSESLAYGGMPAQSTLGFSVGPTLYFPSYLQNYYGWTSYMDVTNVGTGSTTVKVRYYKNDGSPAGGGQTLNLDANASVHLVPSTSATIGGVRIVSENPPQSLAAVMTYEHPTEGSFALAALSKGATETYAPSVFRNYYGWECSLEVFNTSPNSTSVSVRFYGPNGGLVKEESFSLNGYGHREVHLPALANPALPTNWRGGAVVTANRHVVTSVHHGNLSGHDSQGHRGFSGSAPAIHLPWLQQGGNPWWGSLSVMNVGCDNTTATVRFYDANGTQIGVPVTRGLARYASYEFHVEIPNSTRSAVVTTNPSCPVVATVNQARYDIADSAVSYSGID